MKSSISTGASTTEPPDPPPGQNRDASERSSLLEVVAKALQARMAMLDPDHQGAWRLFNGFYEGWPDCVVDVYAGTLLIHDYGDPSAGAANWLPALQAFYLDALPWVQAVLVKSRKSKKPDERRGVLTFGSCADQRVSEHGVRYAIDLRLHQDASFYLDTRNLRLWALENLAGKRVLNAFAYTGSLGVAARAAGAQRVAYLDLNSRFLELARASYELNGFPIHKDDFIIADFFPATSRMRRAGEGFDCVILDPPFYSATGKGVVDLLKHHHKLINKVRPLVKDGGWLVAINNALFLDGAAYLRSLEELAQEGYLSIETLVPAPVDVTGFPHTIVRSPPADPSPFNHPTKIAVLQIRHKDQSKHTKN